MTELTVDIHDPDGVLAGAGGWFSGLSKQLPFAMATAINNTLNDAQTAIRRTLPEHFTLRRKDFVERTVYIGPKDRARKDNLAGTVRINPARDQLAKFEEDHEKRSTSGHALAVPVQRQQTPGLIIGRNDSRNLKRVMALIDAQRGRQVGPFKRRATRRAATQSFFLLHSRKGQTLVMERSGLTTRVLYVFEKTVPIDPQLHFVDTAMKAALEAWDRRATEALERASATMR